MNKTPERQNSRSSSKIPPDIKTIRGDKRKQRMRRDGSGISLSSMNSPIRRRLYKTSMNNTSPFSSPKRVSSVSKSQTPSPFLHTCAYKTRVRDVLVLTIVIR